MRLPSADFFLFSLVIALWSSPVLGQKRCSSLDLPDACTCRDLPASTVAIVCSKVTNSSDVRVALNNAPNCIHFTLADSDIPSLPLGILPHALPTLHVVRSRMPFISPPLSNVSALDSLQNLTRLTVQEVNDIKDWQWSQFERLPRLEAFYILGGSLAYIPNEFSKIGGSRLEDLILQNCGLKDVASGGLAFPSLKLLQIKDDPIEVLRPDMFHQDSKVASLILYGLNLTQLPENVFWNMRDLKIFSTDTTVFPFLTAAHFKDVKLDEFSLFARGEPFCDCNFNWLLRHKIQYIGDCKHQDNDDRVDFKIYLDLCHI